jgi:hypothetical protein
MLTVEDKEFILNKTVLNHPGYILDNSFKNNLNIDNIEKFII